MEGLRGFHSTLGAPQWPQSDMKNKNFLVKSGSSMKVRKKPFFVFYIFDILSKGIANIEKATVRNEYKLWMYSQYFLHSQSH